MADQRFTGMDYDDELLRQIKEGMDVVDNAGDALGKVTVVQFPTADTTESAPEAGDHTQPLPSFSDVVPELGRATTPPPPHTERFIDRMRYSGYVKVNPGLLQGDLYVTPSQVAAVHEDRVQLNVPQGDVIRA